MPPASLPPVTREQLAYFRAHITKGTMHPRCPYSRRELLSSRPFRIGSLCRSWQQARLYSRWPPPMLLPVGKFS
jgi:hypothetical protein